MKKFLPATLDSVIKQNYPNLELIVMDGGSTDGTIDVIKQYENHITYWKSGKDNGHADACNKALDIATGDLINFLNADDVYGDNLLHQVAEVWQKHPQTKMITCGVQIVEQATSLWAQRVIKELTTPNELQLSFNTVLFGLPVINARFFHNDIFKQFGKFQATHADGSYNLSNDRDFLIKLVLQGVSTEIIPQPLYFYLSHDESLTFSKKHVIKSHNEHIKLAEKFLAEPNLTPYARKMFITWYARESVYLALLLLLQGNAKESFEVMKKGILNTKVDWVKQLLKITGFTVIKRAKKLFLKTT